MEVTRGWVAPDNLKPYMANKNKFKQVVENKKYKNRLQVALTQADDASKLSLAERLGKYSFIAKYKGNLNTPKKVTKKDLIRHQKKMKRRFNVEFPIEVSDEEDNNEPIEPKSPKKKRNMILLGTPKRDKTKHIQESFNVADNAVPTPQDIMDVVGATVPMPTKEKKQKMEIQGRMGTRTTPTFPLKKEKTKRRIQDSMNVNDTVVAWPGGTDPSANDDKQLNSMAVQVGSTTDTVVPETESYDNGKASSD